LTGLILTSGHSIIETFRAGCPVLIADTTPWKNLEEEGVVPMDTLVIGGAGFIGSNLVRQLTQQGHNVTVLDNLLSGYRVNLSSGRYSVRIGSYHDKR
jgi:D-arabinose 1-dehydrogenase-like Zn-dependent alcohol dehydrogenase